MLKDWSDHVGGKTEKNPVKWKVNVGFACVCFFVAVLYSLGLAKQGYGILGVGVGMICLCIYLFRPFSGAYHYEMDSYGLIKKIITVMTVLVTVIACTFPMGLNPIWNGEYPGHRDQYERITESFLNGHLDFDYGDEYKLEVLENPYDVEERYRKLDESEYHFDHAYYKGHYYMYFGVVPVFLIFLPYRILSGEPLTTYHATQLFAAMIIIGIFSLFYLLTKLFFKKLPFAVYLFLAAASSVACVWCSVAVPALYCTAITAGVALEIWSLYFFIRAVWLEEKENKQIAFAFIGALLGALVFGCRPPVALANVLVLPMLAAFLKNKKISWKLTGKLLLAALPYLVIGILLMRYNYLRFEDPFEFGQKYQLTVANQSEYGIHFGLQQAVGVYNGIIGSLFGIGNISTEFPFLRSSGAIYNFPILLSGLMIFRSGVSGELKERQIRAFSGGLILTVILIIGIQVMWSPRMLERYHMDFNFLLVIFAFLMAGFGYRSLERKRIPVYSFSLVFASVVTMVNCVLFCMYRTQVSLIDIGVDLWDAISRRISF